MKLKYVKQTIKSNLNRIKVLGKPKYFGIGRNKTGTTSLKIAMQELGFVVGNQRQAELLFDDWTKRKFNRLIRYCGTGEFFQDIPFSLSDTYIAMDKAFPGSKFILTIRDNSEQWYNSLIKFHSKLYADGVTPPTAEQLKNATDYIGKGRPYQLRKKIYNTPDNDLYNKQALIEHYEQHNREVIAYFKDRPDDLLIINVKDEDSYHKLCSFVGRKPIRETFPWENKT